MSDFLLLLLFCKEKKRRRRRDRRRRCCVRVRVRVCVFVYRKLNYKNPEAANLTGNLNRCVYEKTKFLLAQQVYYYRRRRRMRRRTADVFILLLRLSILFIQYFIGLFARRTRWTYYTNTRIIYVIYLLFSFLMTRTHAPRKVVKARRAGQQNIFE